MLFKFVHNIILKLIKTKQLSNTLWRIQKLGFKNNIILTLWKLQNKSNYNISHKPNDKKNVIKHFRTKIKSPLVVPSVA